MKLVATCAAALAVLGLAACGDDVISKSDVEEQATTVIEQQVGEKPKSVSCPEDLKGEKGAKMTCDLTTADDTKLDVNVVVTSVQDDKANFSVEVVEPK